MAVIEIGDNLTSVLVIIAFALLALAMVRWF